MIRDDCKRCSEEAGYISPDEMHACPVCWEKFCFESCMEEHIAEVHAGGAAE